MGGKLAVPNNNRDLDIESKLFIMDNNYSFLTCDPRNENKTSLLYDINAIVNYRILNPSDGLLSEDILFSFGHAIDGITCETTDLDYIRKNYPDLNIVKLDFSKSLTPETVDDDKSKFEPMYPMMLMALKSQDVLNKYKQSMRAIVVNVPSSAPPVAPPTAPPVAPPVAPPTQNSLATVPPPVLSSQSQPPSTQVPVTPPVIVQQPSIYVPAVNPVTPATPALTVNPVTPALTVNPAAAQAQAPAQAPASSVLSVTKPSIITIREAFNNIESYNGISQYKQYPFNSKLF